MKVSARINGRVTSVTVRNSICALHYLICSEDGKDAYDHVLDTCHGIIDTWAGDTGKGLSSYITDKMVEDLLEDTEQEQYLDLITELN